MCLRSSHRERYSCGRTECGGCDARLCAVGVVWVGGRVRGERGDGAAAGVRPPVAAKPRAEVPLWANGAPGSEGKTEPEVVTLQNADGERCGDEIESAVDHAVPGAGVEDAGGGGDCCAGRRALAAVDRPRGLRCGEVLSGHGVAAFVLKYRLAKEKGSTYTVDGDEMADVQRAIRLVKSRAAEWGVDPARVGVMGFSAGGELAVKAAERFGSECRSCGDRMLECPTPVDRQAERQAGVCGADVSGRADAGDYCEGDEGCASGVYAVRGG